MQVYFVVAADLFYYKSSITGQTFEGPLAKLFKADGLAEAIRRTYCQMRVNGLKDPSGTKVEPRELDNYSSERIGIYSLASEVAKGILAIFPSKWASLPEEDRVLMLQLDGADVAVYYHQLIDALGIFDKLNLEISESIEMKVKIRPVVEEINGAIAYLTSTSFRVSDLNPYVTEKDDRPAISKYNRTGEPKKGNLPLGVFPLNVEDTAKFMKRIRALEQ